MMNTEAPVIARVKMDAVVTLYVKPESVQCEMTRRELDKHSIAYRVVDVSTDDEARDHVMSLGHLQAPIVTVAVPVARRGSTDYIVVQHWSAWRPKLIAALVE